MLSQHLIENALTLTGNATDYTEEYFGLEFSIEKFCYYLLSPEFLSKFEICTLRNENGGYIPGEHECAKRFGEAIYKYQSGNEKPLTNLLSTI